jgi:hypothetical protein
MLSATILCFAAKVSISDPLAINNPAAHPANVTDPPAHPTLVQPPRNPNSLTLYNTQGQRVAQCEKKGDVFGNCKIDAGMTFDDVITRGFTPSRICRNSNSRAHARPDVLGRSSPARPSDILSSDCYLFSSPDCKPSVLLSF